MAIVVGVDGSDLSKEALRWALAEARLRKTTLRVVRAWEYPFVPPTVEAFPATPVLEGASAVDMGQLRDSHSDALANWVEEAAPGDVDVEQLVVEGHAAEVLVEAADTAELLVVGSRGHGGFGALLLGSVSQACVHHARCTVAIVRPAG